MMIQAEHVGAGLHFVLANLDQLVRELRKGFQQGPIVIAGRSLEGGFDLFVSLATPLAGRVGDLHHLPEGLLGKLLHDVDDDLRERLEHQIVGMTNTGYQLGKDDQQLVRLEHDDDALDQLLGDFDETLFDLVVIIDHCLGSALTFSGFHRAQLFVDSEDGRRHLEPLFKHKGQSLVEKLRSVLETRQVVLEHLSHELVRARAAGIFFLAFEMLSDAVAGQIKRLFPRSPVLELGNGAEEGVLRTESHQFQLVLEADVQENGFGVNARQLPVLPVVPGELVRLFTFVFVESRGHTFFCAGGKRKRVG